MSQILTPGERPGEWNTLGDLMRRMERLEAAGNCCDDAVTVPHLTSLPDLILAQASLFAYWPCDDTSGDLVDAGPNGLDLAVGSGTPVYGVDGPFGSDLALDLSDSWFDRGSVGGVPFGNLDPYTVIAIVKSPSNADANDGIFQANLGADNIAIYLSTVGGDNVLHALRTDDAVVGGEFPLNEWGFVATRYDGANLDILVSGEVIDSTPDSSNLGSWGSSTQLSIGGLGAPTITEASREYVCHVAVFSAALTDAELAGFQASFAAGGDRLQGTVPVADGAGSYEWLYPLEVTY